MKMPLKMLAFDIETSEQAEDDKISPITVASTVTSDGEERAWFSCEGDPSFVAMTGRGKDEDWSGCVQEGRKPAQLMTKATAKAMLSYMDEKVKQGYVLIAWNGAAFDLKMIGHLAEDVETAGRLALALVDPMYQILSMKGFPVGIAAVCKGLNVDQAKSMDGKDAPEAWKNGEFQKVIRYVIGDSQLTVKVVSAIAGADGIRWTTKAGKMASLAFGRFKTVGECLSDPPVDTSWMSRNPGDKPPIDKKKILAWIPPASRNLATAEAKKAAAKERGEAYQGFLPILFIVSGPSGVGKTFLRDELMRTTTNVMKSTTVTTRQPRKGEVNGVDYIFVTPEKFDQMIQAGAFMEWADVHGNKYGSSKDDVSKRLAMGQDVMLIVDVQGADNIRKFYAGLPANVRSKFRLADIFVTAPSLDEIRRRLTTRGKDAPDVIEQRLANAKDEMARMGEYKYVVMNDDMHAAWDRLRSIVVAERCLNPPAKV